MDIHRGAVRPCCTCAPCRCTVRSTDLSSELLRRPAPLTGVSSCPPPPPLLRPHWVLTPQPRPAPQQPVAHIVDTVLLPTPPADDPSPPLPSPPTPSPPAPSPSPSPTDPNGTNGSNGTLPLPKPFSGTTVFNLTWDVQADMDMIVVARLPTGDDMTMFYSWVGPEPLIGGGTMTASAGGGAGGHACSVGGVRAGREGEGVSGEAPVETCRAAVCCVWVCVR